MGGREVEGGSGRGGEEGNITGIAEKGIRSEKRNGRRWKESGREVGGSGGRWREVERYL